MWKKFPFVLAVLLGLTACSPAAVARTRKRAGRVIPIGYSWAPIWVDSGRSRAC